MAPSVFSLLGGAVFAAVAMLLSSKHTDAGEGLFQSSDLLVSFSFTVATLLVAFLIGRSTSEHALPRTSQRSLGLPDYEVAPLEAPSAKGKMLLLLSKILSHPAFGNLIRRPLLNKNCPEEIRELAMLAASQNYPVVMKPLCRNASGLVTDAMAATATNAIKKGLPLSYKKGEVLGVLDYYQAYLSGKVTPSTMIKQVFDAMDKLQFMNMFVACNRHDVIEQAAESDKRWRANSPLSVFDGVPICAKDMIAVKGYSCSDGKVLRDCDPVATEDDTMVRRFREAGAIILGTTVMTEYGRCPLGYNSHYKGPFNPYNEDFYSGGSSSGSVCAVMTGVCPIAIGFDGGGSIRIPAALSGAFGLSTTYGRIPYDSCVAYTSGNVHAGVNTATATDHALAYALLAQTEPGHFLTKLYGGSEGPPRPHLTDFDKIDDFAGLRIGVFWDYFNDSDPEIGAYSKAVMNELVKRGAKVIEVAVPHLRALSLAHALSMSVDFLSLHEHDFYHRNDLEPATKIQLAVGKTVTGVELLACDRLRGWCMEYMKNLFSTEMDIFLTPGCPIVAPRLDKAVYVHGESNMPLFRTVMRYVFLSNLAGFPAMTMPIAYSTNEGLPISCQMMADHWNDALLLRLSHFVEKNILERKLPKHHAKLFIG